MTMEKMNIDNVKKNSENIVTELLVLVVAILFSNSIGIGISNTLLTKCCYWY